MDIVGHWLHFGNNSVNAVLVLTPNFRKGGRGLEDGVSPFHNFSHKKNRYCSAGGILRAPTESETPWGRVAWSY